MAPRRTGPSSKRAARVPRAQDLVLRVSIRDVRPAIWRRLLIPDRLTLDQLHRVLQLVFGWQDYHVYAFELGARRFEAPDPEAEGEDAAATTLRALALSAGAAFVYRYDFGDDWEHEILVEAVRPRDAGDGEAAWPVLLDGARAGPPEDCGGAHGYAELVATLRRPRSRAYAELRQWLGPTYDPEAFDRWFAARVLTLAAAWRAV
jgi:hypothetical protein